jgi:hypothetical protein
MQTANILTDYNSNKYEWEELEVEVNLRLTVSRSVCPGVRRPYGTRDQFFFLLEIFFRQLTLYYFVTPSLTRGRICNLLVQLLLGLARAVTLGSKSRRTHGHILLFHLRLPQPGGPGSRIYIPPETGWPSYIPGHWVPFLSPLTTSRDYDGCILTRLHTGLKNLHSRAYTPLIRHESHRKLQLLGCIRCLATKGGWQTARWCHKLPL